jgi:hypothetical protein
MNQSYMNAHCQSTVVADFFQCSNTLHMDLQLLLTQLLVDELNIKLFLQESERFKSWMIASQKLDVSVTLVNNCA